MLDRAMHKVTATHYASPRLVSRCEPKQGAPWIHTQNWLHWDLDVPWTSGIWFMLGLKSYASSSRGGLGVTSLREATWGWVNIHPFGRCHLYKQFRIGVWFPGTLYRGLTNGIPDSMESKLKLPCGKIWSRLFQPVSSTSGKSGYTMLHLGRNGSLYLLHVIYESCETALELVCLYCLLFW